MNFSLLSQGINSAEGRVGVGFITTLKVYDLLGREVALLVDEKKPAGTYAIRFDAAGLSSGVYLYRLTAGEYVACRKMVLMK